MDLHVNTKRITVAALAVAIVLAASWTGRASAYHASIDPALHAGDVALIQVTQGTAWTVANELSAAGATDVATLDAIDIVTARVTDAALAAISSDRAVRVATTDAPVMAAGGGRNNTDLDKTGNASGKDSVGITAINAQRAWTRSTGAGVTVALMDTGIAEHPDLPAGKVLARVDFVGDGAKSLDPAGHGTHLAGLIAANGKEFKGVAPDARLVSIRVLDHTGSGTVKRVLTGFDWLLKNRNTYHIRVVNLSFGTTQTTSYHESILSAVVEAAWFAGITVVAAAGNEGPAAGTIAAPGSDPFVVTAGSLDDQGTPSDGDDRESSFSSHGPTVDGFTKPDILAPGRRVVSLRSVGSQLETLRPDRIVKDNGNDRGSLYVRMSGTSVSSAMVAGVAALVLGTHSRYTPTQVKGAIVASGRRISGSSTMAVEAPAALTATPRAVNSKLLPSRLLMTMLMKSGVAVSGITWEGVTWETVTWESVTWESVTWEAVTWEGVVWEGVVWEGVNWEKQVAAR